MGNEIVKDKDIRILLDRREEILNEVNKLQAEYSAIEHILTRLHNSEKRKVREEYERE